jgi:hypothetical protein
VIDPLRREGDAFKVLLWVIAAAAVVIALALLIRAL